MPQMPPCTAPRAGLAAFALGLLLLAVAATGCVPAQAAPSVPSGAETGDGQGEILLERGFVELVFPQGVHVRSDSGESDWPGGRYLFRAVDDRIVSGGRDLGTSVELFPVGGGIKTGSGRQAQRLLLHINAGRIRVILPPGG